MTCKGICEKYKVTKEVGGGGGSHYALGHKFCRLCNVYMKIEEKFCPCCHYMLRTHPRKSVLKARLRDKKNNDV